MRGALIGLVLLVGMGVGGWLGAEHLLAGRVRAAIDADPALQATQVQPLRDPRQFGLTLTEPQFRDPAMGLSLAWARLSVSPGAPLTGRLDLPDRAQITIQGRQMQLELTQPVARLALAPMNRMAPRRLDLGARDLMLDGLPLAEGVSLRMQLAPLGAQSPRAARAAYDADLSLQGVQTAALARLGLDLGGLRGSMAAQGPLRLWLDGTPSLTGGRAPALVGWETPGLDLSVEDIGLRIVGRLSRDDQGRAEGQVALYSADADAMIAMAVGLGLIPAQAQLLLRAGLSQLSQADLDATLPGPDFPDAAPGELRLPIVMRDGRLLLGGVPIGPAPAL